MQYKSNIEARSRNHCCRGKATSVTYSDCVSVAFVIEYAMCKSGIILSAVPCLALLYFSASSHKVCDFTKKITAHKMCVLSLQLLSVTFFHSRNNSLRYYQTRISVFM